MKLSEFKRLVDRAIIQCESSNRSADDIDVVIPVAAVGTVGPHPCVVVESVAMGFDWDSGKYFINPVGDLREINRDEVAHLRKKYDVTAKTVYEANKLRAENKQLKNQLARAKHRGE